MNIKMDSKIKKTKPPPVAPKPSVKGLPLPKIINTLPDPTDVVSPPEEFRDSFPPPPPEAYLPAPEQFTEKMLYAVKERQLSNRSSTSRKPVPKPRHASVSKTSSIESSNSNTSSLCSSSDSVPSSPSQSLQRPKVKARKRRSSINKERFIEKHSRTGLTAALPSDDSAKSRYKDEWIKKKQYLSFQKQHVCRDAKFDSDCNILLTTKFSVQMYDNNGVFKEKLYANRVTEPWGLHINHQAATVLVSDHDEGCVKEFNGLGIIVQEYGPIPNPCGVTVSTLGYVFACSQSEGCVYVFDKRGEIVTKIGKGVLSSPTYVVLHGNSILVSEDSSIIAFNILNEVQFIYGQKDGSDHPGSMCVDTQTGSIFSTSYYKDRIVALNKSMQRAIVIKDTKRPLTCTISPFGHLLIGEHSAKGMLFRMFRM